jgi:thymidylate synthase (FAD)
LEHAGCTLRVEGVSRACMAQLTRHRMASFCVESQRYVKYGFSELDYADKTCIPPSIKFTHKLEPFSKHMEACQQLYNELVDAGGAGAGRAVRAAGGHADQPRDDGQRA